MLGYRLLHHEPQPWDEAAFAPPGRPPVAVVRASSYDSDLEATVLDGLRAVGADVRGKSVLLKPNYVEYDAGTVINTDPRLVAAAVLALRRLGARTITVGEGPGHRRDTEYVVSTAGLLDALAEVDAPFVDLNVAPLARRPLHSRYTDLRELWLPKPVVDADVVVSVPKMKAHHLAGVTLSLKNCFGCVPGRVYGWPKNVLHWAGIEASIVDVSAAVRPSLAIVDGITGMEGDGPIMGTPIDAGRLVFSTDPVAADATAARLMGVDPAKVAYLVEAGRFLGQGDLERIHQVGEDVEGDAVPFRLVEAFQHLRA
jgi:uncharacterized protein (DUF362 family)